VKTLFLILSLLLAIVVTIGYIWFCIESMLNSLPYRIGYVSSNLDQCIPILEEIISRYVKRPQKTAFIEPGAGLAHLSHWAKDHYAWKCITAIELNLSLLFLARLLDLKRGKGVRYVRTNLLQFTYPKGSFVYCYLYEPILQRLYTEGRLDGCLVVSLTFAIPDVKPTEEIAVPGWQKRMLVYDFR